MPSFLTADDSSTFTDLVYQLISLVTTNCERQISFDTSRARLMKPALNDSQSPQVIPPPPGPGMLCKLQNEKPVVPRAMFDFNQVWMCLNLGVAQVRQRTSPEQTAFESAENQHVLKLSA